MMPGMFRLSFAVSIVATGSLLTLGCNQPAQLRVMSFNIRYAAADDGPNGWTYRRSLAFETIRAQAPDILGLQEPLAGQVAEFRAALPEYGFVGVGRVDGVEAGEFVPIFYRHDRFTLLEKGHFWLSDQPDRPGSVGWDAALTRMATWVRLRLNGASGGELQVVNTHFDHQGERARLESARQLRRFVESLGDRPVIVIGDFNCDPMTEPYRALTEVRENRIVLRDAFAAPAETGGTYHAFTGRPEGGRIDWILCGPRFDCVAAAVDRRAFDGRYPSDHFPVVATLRLKAS
jgi:endonuclease/exonuclease/phosphatase family metal-dependent hydrolase